MPRGGGAQPQEGLVAVISSQDPQAKEDFVEEPEAPEPAVEEEPAVAARVHDPDESDVERIERRRWFIISAGAGAVAMQSPSHLDYEPDAEIRPRLTASAGIFVLPNLNVGGFLGVVSVDGTDPDGSELSAQELYKAVGATLYFGTPGNVPGDVYPFIQGGHVWYDISYGTGGDPDVTGTGFFGGAGAIFTIRRTFGIYVAAQALTSSFDEDGVVFDRTPVEINAGATVIF